MATPADDDGFLLLRKYVLIASVIKFHDNDGDSNDDTHHPGSLLFLLHNDATTHVPFTVRDDGR